MKSEKSKSMPLRLLRAMEIYKDLDTHGLMVVSNSNSYLRVEDPDPASNFFFSIDMIEAKETVGNSEYLISFRPTNDEKVDAYIIKVGPHDLKGFYSRWKKRIEEYAVYVPSQLVSDPILEQYQQEYYSEFELTDDDTDIHSFTTKEQVALDNYLTFIVQKLEAHKEKDDTREEVKDEIDTVITAAKELQDTQTKLTKNQVAKKLANILAQCKKVSLKILGEVRSEVVKALVRGAMENPQGYLDTIGNLLS